MLKLNIVKVVPKLKQMLPRGPRGRGLRMQIVEGYLGAQARYRQG